MEQEFTVLENKAIGRNFAIFRKVRDMKASEVAQYIGISETAYGKYERGESKITIDAIQKVAECLKVDPLQIISTAPDNFIESITNNPNAQGLGIGNTNTIEVSGDYYAANEKQNEAMIGLMERLILLLEKR